MKTIPLIFATSFFLTVNGYGQSTHSKTKTQPLFKMNVKVGVNFTSPGISIPGEDKFGD